MGTSDDDPTADEEPTQVPVKAVSLRAVLDDDRPTEIHDVERKRELHSSREQLITGRTIAEMMNNSEHSLSDALSKLYTRARSDLPAAQIDARSSLMLRHEFEFDRRVGYFLTLKLFDKAEKCVEVNAEVDQDGRAIRRGSMDSKLIQI